MLTVVDPLAFMTAKSHGLEEEYQNILEASGLTEDQLTLPTMGRPLQPPKPVVPTHKANWPVKAASHSFFEKALLGEVGAIEDDTAPAANGFDHGDVAVDEANVKAGQLGEEEDEDAAGWDMGDDINVEVEPDFINVDSAETGPGSSEADIWARNSPIAADHVAGGSFETAMQLLNRQVGAANFAPLKPRFLEIYRASKTYLPATVGLPPLVNYVRRTVDEADSRKVLPIIPRDLEVIANVDLQEGYSAMRSNKLDEGLKTFKRILHCLLVNSVSSKAQVDEAKKLIATATEYATAMAMELERRSLPTEGDDNLKRSLELSAFFTIPKLEVPHRQLALMAAMKLAFTNKNYSSALSFANRMIANGGSSKPLEQVSSQNGSEYGENFSMTSRRLIKSKPNASETHRTELTSSSTNLPSSTCALHHIRQSIADRQAPLVPLTDRNTIPNTRDIFVKFAKFAKSALQRAGFVCSSPETGRVRIVWEGT